jgi:PKD repeat protein
MTNFYIDAAASPGGNGSIGSPWKTFAQSTASGSGVGNGDIVRVKAGTYSEFVKLNKAGASWIADNPAARPVIDGGYNASGIIDSSVNINMRVPHPTETKPLLDIAADNITVDGIIVQNAPNNGVTVTAHNATLKNFVIFFCYLNGFLCNATKNPAMFNGLTVKNGKIFVTSLRYFDEGAVKPNGSPCGYRCQGGAGMLIGSTNGPVLVEDVEIAYNFGEGLDIDKDLIGTVANPVVFNRVKMHDANHTTTYFNQARGIILKNSVSYWTTQGATIHSGTNGEYNTNLRIKDESEVFNATRDIQIYNCLFINGGNGMIWGGNPSTTPDLRDGARGTSTTNFYLGHNTFVTGPNTNMSLIHVGASAAHYQDGLAESNIFHAVNSPNYTGNISKESSGCRVVFRNNNWSKAHNGLAGTNDIIGNPLLLNPGKLLVTSNYFTKATTSYALWNTTDNFDPNDYKLTSGSPGKGNGAAGTAPAGTVNPIPTAPRQYDRVGFAREGVPDMGAWEYGSTDDGGEEPPPPPTGTVTANFTFAPAGGPAGTSIAFTDTSIQTGAAVINKRTWRFGDGNESTATNPTHIYNTPGDWVPTLTVEDTNMPGISSVKTGATISITAPPVGGGNSVLIGSNRAALRSSSGRQTITVTELGTLEPKAAIIHIVRAGIDNAPDAGEYISVGWCTKQISEGSIMGQVSISTVIKEALPTSADTFSSANSVATLLDENGVVIGNVKFFEWVQGGIVLDVTNATGVTNFTITVTLLGGAHYKAEIRSILLGEVSPPTYSVPSTFAAATARFMGTLATVGNAVDSSDVSFGYAKRGGNSYSVGRWYDSDSSRPYYAMALSSGEVLERKFGAVYAHASINTWTESSLNLAVFGQGIFNNIFVMFESYGNAYSDVSLIGAQTVTQTLGWQPQYVEHILSRKNGATTASNSRAGAIGFHVKTEDAEFSNIVSGDYNVPVADNLSLSDVGASIAKSNGNLLANGTTAITSTGYVFTWESGPLDDYQLPRIVVGIGENVGGGTVTADFSATPRSGFAPLSVQFKNLSSTSAVSFEWDFGDGTPIVTEKEPEHTYQAGSYSVTLAVSDGVNEDVTTKVRYINVEEPFEQDASVVIVGPYLYRMVAGLSFPITHYSPGDAKAGIVELPAGNVLNPAYLIENDGEPDVLFGYAAAWVDLNTGNIKLKRANGQVGTVTVSYEALVTTEYTIAVAQGDHDGSQAGTVVDVTSTNINVNATTQYGIVLFVLDVPQYATIDESFVVFNFSNADFSSPDVILYGQAADAALAVTTVANNISDRTPTSAQVSWLATSLGTGGKNSPDIKSIIQEIVNRDGYVRGNLVGIIIKGNSNSSLFRFRAEEGVGDAAQLFVRYTAGA